MIWMIDGLMFGSLTSAIVGTLTYFSTAEYKNLPSGPWESGNLSWTSIGILFLCVLVGFLVFCMLNALLKEIMRSLGLNYKEEQGLSSFCYQCFGRSITAFRADCLYSLAVPHIAKLVFRPVTTLYYFGVLCFFERYRVYLE
jgi:iron complex transport system permease protein